MLFSLDPSASYADYYERAKVALNKSLDLRSGDPSAASAMTNMAVACMSEHRFADALDWAQNALALGSGDPSPWAIVGDALADMGDYDAAADAYARLQNPLASQEEKLGLSFARESRLSSLDLVAGHTEKAIELMRSAARTAIETHMTAENIAWSEYQLGEELFQVGDPELILRRLAVILEERMQALHGSRFPMCKELGLEIVLAAKLRLVGGAAEKFQDKLGLELGRKGPSLTTRHCSSPGGVQYLSCYWSSARGAPH